MSLNISAQIMKQLIKGSRFSAQVSNSTSWTPRRANDVSRQIAVNTYNNLIMFNIMFTLNLKKEGEEKLKTRLIFADKLTSWKVVKEWKKDFYIISIFNIQSRMRSHLKRNFLQRFMKRGIFAARLSRYNRERAGVRKAKGKTHRRVDGEAWKWKKIFFWSWKESKMESLWDSKTRIFPPASSRCCSNFFSLSCSLPRLLKRSDLNFSLFLSLLPNFLNAKSFALFVINKNWQILAKSLSGWQKSSEWDV